VNLGEVQFAGSAGHDVLPLAVELGCVLGEQGGAHLRRGGIGERRPIGCRSGLGGGHDSTIAVAHDMIGRSAPLPARDFGTAAAVRVSRDPADVA
jgi:hypothetical protein